MRVYGVAGKPNYMDISNFPTSYFNPCRKDKLNVVCVVYDNTSGRSSLWVNRVRIRDFACRLTLRASTLNGGTLVKKLKSPFFSDSLKFCILVQLYIIA